MTQGTAEKEHWPHTVRRQQEQNNSGPYSSAMAEGKEMSQTHQMPATQGEHRLLLWIPEQCLAVYQMKHAAHTHCLTMVMRDTVSERQA